MVTPPGHEPAHMGPEVEPLTGDSEQLAEAFRGFAREGIAQLQLVLNPCTESAVEALEPVVELLDRG